MKQVSKWSDEEISEQVRSNLSVMVKTDGKGLTKEQIKLDKELKAEFWRREELGLHEDIGCMICKDENVSYYDIAKAFCGKSNEAQGQSICNKHKEAFNQKLKEFMNDL